jgi:hypothetical protein
MWQTFTPINPLQQLKHLKSGFLARAKRNKKQHPKINILVRLSHNSFYSKSVGLKSHEFLKLFFLRNKYKYVGILIKLAPGKETLLVV